MLGLLLILLVISVCNPVIGLEIALFIGVILLVIKYPVLLILVLILMIYGLCHLNIK